MPGYTVEFGKDGKGAAPDGRLDAAAFHRNHRAIWEALAPFLAGRSGDVLEAGSGTGQHVMFFAAQTPGLTWWPSDLPDAHLRSIAAWRDTAGLANVRAPLRIDLSSPDWAASVQNAGGPARLLALVCANVIHIAPWRVAEGLFAGAAQLLQPGGRLFLYGPFSRGGQHTAPSNAAFDASLRSADPTWGVRDVDDVAALASGVGLVVANVIDMPANNLVLSFANDRASQDEVVGDAGA